MGSLRSVQLAGVAAVARDHEPGEKRIGAAERLVRVRVRVGAAERLVRVRVRVGAAERLVRVRVRVRVRL